ncbi:MAG TPA: hypothetical protein VNH22_20970 [Blastocatellia bacterium]|nr:hypothetical protein [Blastocatellia bacterium]
MSTRFMAVLLAAVLAAAGVLALSNSPRSNAGNYDQASAPALKTALSADPGANNEAYIGDFKSGYADGFNAGVAGLSYPDESSMEANSRGFLDGFSQGYTDGQGQQASLRNQLCRTAGTAALSSAPAYYGERYGRSSYGSSSRTSSGTLGDRAYRSSNDDVYYRPREDRGIGSTARKALLIGGGAAAGAGLGGAIGGKKGALIGALVGGGTGTALAVTKKPSRAFNRSVSRKSVLTKGLIGAGAGAVVGALIGGKRGALAGAALGGGGGALWGVVNGKRSSRRY